MTKREPDPIRIQLTLGVLGFIGVLLTVLATIFGPIIQENLRQKNQPTQTPIVIVASPTQAQVIPTDTVPVGNPTSTPAPATDTPVPTFTAVPPVALGEDWIKGCISTLWKPYPANTQLTEKGDGCWQEPVIVFSAENGDLDFLAERSGAGTTDIRGLFVLLPENGTVTFKVRLRDLSNVDILMGVYSTSDLASDGLLMTIPSGNPKKTIIVQKDNVTDYNTLKNTIKLDQGDGFSITFKFDSLSASSTVNPSVFVTNPISLPSAQKWLFLGYKGLSGSYRVEGTFLSFELK
ncbi:MAG: hypothetical protein ABI904_05540 [Chloroflexota bacterium]